MADSQPIKRSTVILRPCPFCGQRAEFRTTKSGTLLLEHNPTRGVNCPARLSQVCDNEEQGMSWWNKRV